MVGAFGPLCDSSDNVTLSGGGSKNLTEERGHCRHQHRMRVSPTPKLSPLGQQDWNEPETGFKSNNATGALISLIPPWLRFPVSNRAGSAVIHPERL